MEEGQLFSELKLNGKPLNSCSLALECNRGNYRLYLDVESEFKAFYTMAVSFVSCVSDGNIWQCPELRVDQLFNSVAYFDGVRHLEFNREAGDMAGYIYYPDMQGLIDMFTKVREIELALCSDYVK